MNKYKIGDKVKIVKDSGIFYLPHVENILIETNYILTVKDFDVFGYCVMEEIEGGWADYTIECLVEEEIYDPIYSRFEILDL